MMSHSNKEEEGEPMRIELNKRGPKASLNFPISLLAPNAEVFPFLVHFVLGRRNVIPPENPQFCPHSASS